MIEEIKLFRRSLLGGFNRRDVISYIEMLARERNKSREAQTLAEEAAKKLEDEVSSLKSRLEESQQQVRDFKVAALEEASAAFTELEEVYNSVRADIENTSANVCAELTKAGGAISRLPSALEKTGERLEELRCAVESEKNEAAETISCAG